MAKADVPFDVVFVRLNARLIFGALQVAVRSVPVAAHCILDDSLFVNTFNSSPPESGQSKTKREETK